MSLTAWEAAARHFEPEQQQFATPGALAVRLLPATVQTPALEFIDDALVDAMDKPDGRLIITMSPQEGKSTRVVKDLIVWALKRNPDLRIVAGSYAQSLANRNGRAVRNTITAHPELGLAIADDSGAASEWQIKGHEGGLLSVGRGAGVTGRPADAIVIDDPIKDRKEADSEVVRDTVWDWWIDSLSTRLAPGAPVIIILTRWHEDDLVGRLLAAEDGHLWRVINIPAQADHDPNKGETDLLGRKPGEYMISARGRTPKQWEAIKTRVGSRTWASLYQGRPAPQSGDVLQRTWWRRYDLPLWIDRADGARIVTNCDDMIMSWDLSFKDTKTSDWVVGQVWMRRHIDAFLLDQVRGRWDFVETCRQFEALAARWPQALLKVIEDKANGPAVISALRRKVPGIVPEEPQGSKEARASAVAPLLEAGNVWIPAASLAPWADGLIEEAAGFPHGKHDDQVDATSQALNRLILQPLLAGDQDLLTEEDLDDDIANYQISPY